MEKDELFIFYNFNLPKLLIIVYKMKNTKK